MTKSIDANVADRLDDLRITAKSRLDQFQTECAPYLGDGIIDIKEQYSYIRNGYLEHVHDYSFRVFKIDGLRFINYDKSKQNVSILDSMENMVNKNIVHPFLLFANGSVIKWSDIDILKDFNYTYLMVKNLGITSVDLHIVEFPCHVRYGEDDNILDPKKYPLHFYFDPEGHLTTGDIIDCRLEVVDPSIYGELLTMSEAHPYIEIKTEDGQLAAKNCIVPFRSGMIDPSELNNMTHMGWNIYKTSTPSDMYERYIYAVFYWKKGNKSSGMMYRDTIDKDNMKKEIIKSIKNDAKSFITDLFSKDFDFKYSYKNTYYENTTGALRYVDSYDANLMDATYDAIRGIYTFKTTGEYLISKANDKGILCMSGRKDGKLNSRVIIFRNGLLYEYMNDVSYKPNGIDIPVIGFKPEDDVEIVYFTRVNNEKAIVTMHKDQVKYISDDLYDINDMHFYTKNPPKLYYGSSVNLDPKKYTEQFEIGYTYEDKGNGNYIFTMDFDFYEEPLTLVSGRQFHHVRATDKDFFTDDYYFPLPDEFAFCKNKNQYLVFINGQLMSKRNFTCTSSNIYRPFEEMIFYVTTRLQPGDVVDIYYVPDEVVDIAYKDDMDLSGDIIIDAQNLEMPISKENCIITVNGIKANQDQIINISRNQMRVKTDMGSIHNITIMRTVDLIDDLVKFFQDTTSDEWKDYFDSLTREQQNQLMNCYLDIKDGGADYMVDHYNLDAVVNDIIFDFYMKKAGLTLRNSIFVYDFELNSGVALNDGGKENIIPLNTIHPDYEKIHQYRYNLSPGEKVGLSFEESAYQKKWKHPFSYEGIN